MATKIIKAQITQRHDTRSNWESVNPVLLEGELGIVSDDPNLYKVGDGRTEWNNLPYRGFDGTLVQEEGTSANAAMSQKAVTEALAKKPDTTGTYPSMRVGTADDLAGRGESVPAEFTFRASGGKSIKDGRAYLKAIKGNSVVWNQMFGDFTAQSATISVNGNLITLTKNGDFPGVHCKGNIIVGHKYICIAHRNDGNTMFCNAGGRDGACNVPYIASNNNNARITIYTYGDAAVDEFTMTKPLFIDLTKAFPNDWENINTIEEFNARVATLGIDMYAYNEGQVIHMNTESIKSVGDNAFNGVWYQGGVSDNDGSINTSQSDALHTDTFRVIGGETYCSQFDGADLYLKGYFFDKSGAFIGSSDFDVWQGTKKWVAPINAYSVRMRLYNGVSNITPSQAPNVMIRLEHSGWKSDIGVGYEPYWEDTLPLPIIRKYFPDGMMKAGTAHDEIRYNKASGKWEKVVRIVEMDMGTLNWYHDASLGGFYSDTLVGAKKLFEGICAKYPFVGDYRNVTDKTCGYVYELCVLVKDSSYTDAASFKAAMQGVMFYYELAEPIVTEITEDFRDYYNVADFGTEMSQSNVPSAPFRADIIYQFNAVDMIREHELEITELQNIIATMQAQLTSLINGVATLQV